MTITNPAGHPSSKWDSWDDGGIFTCIYNKSTTNEPGKEPGRILSIESWLFNRDPYDGLL